MDDDKTVWCGNLSEKVDEELLYELFLQAAPLERVKIPTDREGRASNFAFVTFKHVDSVNYAVQLLNGIKLYDRAIAVKPRNNRSNQNNQQNSYQAQQDLGDMQQNAIQLNLLQLAQLGQSMNANYDMQQHHHHHQQHYGGGRHQGWDNSRDHYRDRQNYRRHDNMDHSPRNSPNQRRKEKGYQRHNRSRERYY